ncbi:Glutathione synthase, N-terminal, eukaryotic [Sesbania bispinosa]|nr:Glutathione synthase, N-terminal, eukaryotic [Sesbania bispinosa]
MVAGSACLVCCSSSSGTRHLNTYTSFSSSFRHQSLSLSFPKHLKLMSQHLTISPTTNNVEEVDGSSLSLPRFDYHRIDEKLLHHMVYDALVWATLNGLLVGDQSVQVIT